ncbi:MAG: hypothetical protein JO200_16465 [Comamonas sp.]|nr:hypothetical protein [Comamonas sp.]
MFGLSSRPAQRKEPTWTQAAAAGSKSEPVWRDAAAAPAYEPSQVQAGEPRKTSSAKLWLSVLLAVAGLLAVAYLLLRMVNVVEEQMARSQPQRGSAGASVPAAVNAPGR